MGNWNKCAIWVRIHVFNKEGKFVQNLYLYSGRIKDDCKFRPEATTRSDILYSFGQENLIFIREK